MNEIDNDYTVLEMPNILFERSKRDSSTTPVTTSNTKTHPFMFPLIERIALARPKWRLVATRRSVDRSNSGLTTFDFEAHHFDVYENGVKLGHIWKGYENRGDVIRIDNDRMTKARKRGAFTSTIELDKAFKIVVKNFHGKTTKELVKDTHDKVHGVVNMLVTNRRAAFYSKYNHINDFMVAYAMKNWDHTKQEAADAGINPLKLDGIQEAYAETLATDEIIGSLCDRIGATVTIRGDDYIVVINNAVSIFDTDHLPPHIKRSIGILKMVEDNSYVADHGVRVSKDMFFVSSKAGATS